MRTLDVRPKKIMLKEKQNIQLEVYAVSADGKEEKIPYQDIHFQVREKSGFECGYIDDDGILHTGDPGVYCFDIGVEYEDLDKKILTESYTVLQDTREDNTIKDDPPIKKRQVTLSRMTCTDLAEKAKQDRKKISTIAHTRAIYRTLAQNKDLVWLFFLCCFAIAFGGCFLLILNGVSIERISALLTVLLGFLISLFGKIYTPPGEVSEAITDRILGTTEDEKIQKLQTKIQKLTQKKNQNRSFYRYTIDENQIME